MNSATRFSASAEIQLAHLEIADEKAQIASDMRTVVLNLSLKN
jgi:hypothetical protein